MEPQFESFEEIKKLSTALMTITQKIHGTNAQVLVYQKEDGTLDLAVGSRTRWIAPGSDNYGFATHVYAHKQEFIEKLGLGRHYGEWAGPGINSGEGLSQKTFFLFNHFQFPPERPLPPQTSVVPVLYSGAFDLGEVEKAMVDLKANGSKLVPSYNKPEGVVVRVKGDRYKVVFTAEESQWCGRGPKAPQEPRVEIPVDHLLQPVRLEKLLSRDENYFKAYPQSLATIAKDYMADLEKEEQITGTDAERRGIKKAMSSKLFVFIKEFADPAFEAYESNNGR